MNIKIHFKCFLTLYLFKTSRFAINVLRISFKKKSITIVHNDIISMFFRTFSLLKFIIAKRIKQFINNM